MIHVMGWYLEEKKIGESNCCGRAISEIRIGLGIGNKEKWGRYEGRGKILGVIILRFGGGGVCRINNRSGVLYNRHDHLSTTLTDFAKRAAFQPEGC